MAARWAVANGNWSSTATWNGGTLPSAGDDVYTNGKSVTVDDGYTTPVVALLSTAENSGLGVVAGGTFNLGAGCTLQADVVQAGSSTCVSTGGTVSCTLIAGTVVGGTASNVAGVTWSSSGTLTAIVGLAVGGGYNNTNASGIYMAAGTLIYTGDAVGSGSNANAAGIHISSGSGHSVAGVCMGGVGGAPGLLSNTGAQVAVSVAQANDYPNGGALAGALGTYQSNAAGSVLVDAMIFGAGGWHPVQGRHFLRAEASANFVQMRLSNNGDVASLGEVAADYPAASNVRSGVVYDFGGRTGTCAVPPPGSVALGVPVDATTGTAALSAEALLGSALKTRLENCATVQTVGDQLAALGA